MAVDVCQAHSQGPPLLLWDHFFSFSILITNGRTWAREETPTVRRAEITPGLAQVEPAVSSTHFCPAGARKVLLRTCMVPSSAAEQPVEEPHAGDEHVNVEANDPPQRPRAQTADG